MCIYVIIPYFLKHSLALRESPASFPVVHIATSSLNAKIVHWTVIHSKPAPPLGTRQERPPDARHRPFSVYPRQLSDVISSGWPASLHPLHTAPLKL